MLLAPGFKCFPISVDESVAQKVEQTIHSVSKGPQFLEIGAKTTVS
jgi:hypothetical protein